MNLVDDDLKLTLMKLKEDVDFYELSFNIIRDFIFIIMDKNLSIKEVEIINKIVDSINELKKIKSKKFENKKEK